MASLLLVAAAVVGVSAVLRYLGIAIGPLGLNRSAITMAIDDPALAYTNPFSWSNLSVGSNGRYHYLVEGHEQSRSGIDVSQHQGTIDWAAVKADGIDFAYIRIGYRGSDTGIVLADSQFRANFDGARAAGLDVGVYFYSEAISVEEAQAEAAFVLSELGGASLTYPVAFDYEPTGNDSDRIAALPDDQMSAIAQAFCQAIEDGGRSAVVYGNASDLARMQAQNLSRYGYWYASYTTRPTVDLAFGIWQYSSSGSVDGISTPVDLDIDLTGPLASYLAAQRTQAAAG